MMICKPIRERSEAHRKFVATIPCLVCRRGEPVPRWHMLGDVVSQSHHLTHAQPRARGLKVSDAYSVPLCVPHHDPNHRGSVHHDGDEAAWWELWGIDPLAEAARLWNESIAAGRVKLPRAAA
jgi:hypothetical protein